MTPDRWLVLEVRVAAEAGGPEVEEGLVTDVLVGLGGRAVEEWAGGYRTHLPPPDDPRAVAREARWRLAALPGIRDADVAWRWQPHEEWVEAWKRGLAARRISEGLVVAPSWIEAGAPDDVVVRIDPGVAFGTAEHPTTRASLRLLQEVVAPGTRVVDLGAGSGIVAVTAGLLGAGRVLAVEADALACEIARQNARLNGVEDRVRVVEARVGGGRSVDLGRPDGIVANIDTAVLLDLLPGMAGALTGGGWLILAGVRDVPDERDRIVGAAAAERLVLDREERQDGWWSARFTLADRR